MYQKDKLKQGKFTPSGLTLLQSVRFPCSEFETDTHVLHETRQDNLISKLHRNGKKKKINNKNKKTQTWTCLTWKKPVFILRTRHFLCGGYSI